MLISLTFWINGPNFLELQYIICSILILFFTGVKDDIFDLVPYKKLLAQVFCAFLLIHFGNIRLTSLYGLFGVYDISLFPSYALSLITNVGLTNSFNFIDGIDMLAGGVGVLISFIFGFFFYEAQVYSWSLLSFSLAELRRRYSHRY